MGEKTPVIDALTILLVLIENLVKSHQELLITIVPLDFSLRNVRSVKLVMRKRQIFLLIHLKNIMNTFHYRKYKSLKVDLIIKIFQFVDQVRFRSLFKKSVKTNSS